MQIAQIYEMVNSATAEYLGEENILQEDLSNIVDIGGAIEDVIGYDHYVRNLANVIGRTVFVNREYNPIIPNILRDGWEYGSILQKIWAQLPEAEENEAWELEDGVAVDNQVFRKPSVEVTYYNKRVTFEIDMSFTEMQVKESFKSATQLGAFVAMLYNAIKNSMQIKLNSLIMRTINNLIAETIHDDFGSDTIANGSHVKAVNLLYLYNQTVDQGDEITADEALRDVNFLKFASKKMLDYADRLKSISTVFNVKGAPRFTPENRLNFVMLSEFKNAANVYLQSDTFHNEFTKMPESTSIPFWQGILSANTNAFDFANASTINVKTASGDTVTTSGVIGVMFDTEACAVTCENPRVKTFYNPKGEFWNEFHKYDAGYLNDLAENAVVFLVA